MWRRRASYDPERPLRPWIAGIAFRVKQQHRRRGARELLRGFVDQTDHAPLPDESIRFFPLVPLLSRGLAEITPFDERASLVIVANASALALGLLLYRLICVETGDATLARRSVWVLALAPPAYVYVMGYSEATASALAVVTLPAVRLGIQNHQGPPQGEGKVKCLF